MRLCVSVYNLKQLNSFLDYADAFVLHFKEGSLVYDDLNLALAVDLCLAKNKLAILALDRLAHDSDLDVFNELFKQYGKLDVRFLVTDIGVCNLAFKLNLNAKIIFDPQTMITNTLDLIEYDSYGFDALALSLEIPFKDVITSKNESKAELFYLIFGHRMMFYSKRKLLSLYKDKAKIELDSNKLYLREATREDYLPIIENQNGTMIYRSYLLSLLPFKEELSSFKYGYLNPLYVDDDLFFKVLKIYYSVFKGELLLADGIKKINELRLDIKDGFTFEDSIYQKELF